MRRAAVILALASRTALAQPADDKERIEQGRKAFLQAKALHAQQRYGEELLAYEEAYKLVPDARGAVLGLALAHADQYGRDHKIANLRRAVKLLHEYLGLADADHRTTARSMLDTLEPELKRIEDEIEREVAKAVEPPAPPPPAPPPPTTLIISGSVDAASVAFEGGTPQIAPAVFETTPGKHRVIVTAPGYKPAERDASAVDAQTVSIEVPLEELPATLITHAAFGRVYVDGKPLGEVGDRLPVPPGRHRVTIIETGHLAWAHDLDFVHGATREVEAELPISNQRALSRYVAIGAGAIALAGGLTTIAAYAAQSRAQGFNAIIGNGGTLTQDQRTHYDHDIDRRDQFRTTSIVLFSAATAATATAALLYFVDTPRVEPGAPPALVPAVGPGTLGATWQGRF